MATNPEKDRAAAFLQEEIARLKAREQTLVSEKKALIDEFMAADEDTAPETIKRNVKARIPRSLEVLDEILETSKSDGVRAGIAKFYINVGLGKIDFGGDPTAKELAKLFATIQSDE